jgi:AraC-like DNA-binding protein/ligand-binding sensor protein
MDIIILHLWKEMGETARIVIYRGGKKMHEKKLAEKEINEIVKTYTISTKVNCFAFDVSGEVLTCKGYWDRSTFCEFVQGFDYASACKQSYFYGGIQSDKIGETYIYFCPYGLVNWTVPVIQDNKTKFFLTAGPVLIHRVDDLLIRDIIEQNHLLKARYREVRARLGELEVVEPDRVKYLGDLLFRLAKNLMVDNILILDNRRQKNIINNDISEIICELKKEFQIQNIEGEVKQLYPFEKEKQLISRVRVGDKKGAREILNEVLGYIYLHNEFELVKLKAISLMVVLARTAIEVGANLEIIFGLEYVKMRRILEVEDISVLAVELAKVLDGFIECAFSSINIENRDVIFKAMNYIRNNYANISLKEVAAEVALNPTYFSKLFKKETGRSYTDYLNKVRVDVSKRLLKKDLPLAEIAQMVGFGDQSYFSKTFKKYEGISPNKWRQKNNL